MANGRLIDTNVIIRIMKKQIPLPQWVQIQSNVFVSIITLGELLLGAELSARTEINRDAYTRFCGKFSILPVDFSVARSYAKVKSALRKIGKPIPDNDVWIAATALAFDLVVVTGDNHFDVVPDLLVEHI